MLIIKSRGELGNQIFQYGAAKQALRPRETLVLLGFHQFLRTFPRVRARTLKYPYKKKATKRVQSFWLWLQTQVERGAVGTLLESSGGSPNSRIEGRTRTITVAEGFFQEPQNLDWEAINELADSLADSSHGSLSQNNSRGEPLACFVHIRRGDYLRWPNEKSPAALPAEWYQTQMRTVQDWATPEQVDFYIFSDDIELARQEIGHFPNTYFHSGTAEQDFVAMCSAQAGILSASTFSWWAAYFASRKSSGLFLAPRYWLGFRQREWQPPSLKADFLTFVDV